MTFTDADYPALPYPGARPDCSFAHADRVGHPLRPGGASWEVHSGQSVDGWLADRGAAPLGDRVPVLAYGSNANPAKITWLRDTLGLPGPAVLLRARCTGIAAVWASGLRVVDDQRPATLAALPGVVEWHAVWLATPEQVAVLDVCEGRGDRYHLAELTEARITVEGAALTGVLGYVGAGARRMPLLVDGAPVRCTQVGQAAAQALTGVAATDHGLTVRIC